MLGDFFEQLDAGFGGEASDGDSFDLRLDRFDDFRMAVAESVDADAADDVDESIAVDVRQGASAAFVNDDSGHGGEVLVAGGEVFFLAGSQFAALRAGDLRSSRFTCFMHAESRFT